MGTQGLHKEGEKALQNGTKLRNLTAKESRFISEFCTYRSIVRAYESAYQPRPTVSRQRIYEMSCQVAARKPVKAAIARVRQAIFDANKMTLQDFVLELIELARGDLTDMISIQGQRVVIKDTSEIPTELRKCIKSIKEKPYGLDGETYIEVEFYDKSKWLDMLGRHLGAFARDNESLRQPVIININTSVQQAQE